MSQKEYYIADTPEKVNDIITYVNNITGLVAVDTETKGSDPLTCEIVGIAFCGNVGESFYIPLNLDFTEEVKHDIRVKLVKLLEDKRKKWLMHNASFDVIVIRRNIGANTVPNLHADTMLMKHTIDEVRPHSLKETAMKYLGEEWGQEREDLKASVLKNGGKWTKDDKEMYKADLSILGKYACSDVDMTYRLFLIFDQKLKEQGLDKFFYEDEVMPLNKEVVIEMKETGLKVDLQYYNDLKKQLTQEIIDLEESVHTELQTSYPDMYNKMETELLNNEVPITPNGSVFETIFELEGYPIVYNDKGNPTFTAKIIKELIEDHPTSNLLLWRTKAITTEEFTNLEMVKIIESQKLIFKKRHESKYVINIGSNDQLGKILFDHLGETPEEKTEKGKAKVDEDVLEGFASKYKFIDQLMQLKKRVKLLSTYVEAPLTRNINSIIHPEWMQHGTESGRFSCKEPNYQNLPREDKRIKYGIVAREGKVLIDADYSQLEPRIFSHTSNEPSLIKAFADGKDFYGTLAVDNEKLNCDANEVKSKFPELRQTYKTIGLAIAYGAKKWKISTVLNISQPKADKIVKNYWKSYKNLERYVNQCHGTVLAKEEIKTEAGRKRRFPGINQLRVSKVKKDQSIYHNLLNLSVNFPIQSLAASIVNRSMLRMNREFKKQNIDARVLAQIHDEVICESSEKDQVQAMNIMKESMEQVYKLRVPLVAQPIAGKRLSECK